MNAVPLWTNPLTADAGRPMPRCGPSAGGAACPGKGQCCNEDVGVCLAGSDLCSALPTSTGRRFDGPPGTHKDPYRAPNEDNGDRPGGPQSALKCGPKANALCPWSPHGQDLLCVADAGGHGDFSEASCVRAGDVEGRRKLFVWAGRWTAASS